MIYRIANKDDINVILQMKNRVKLRILNEELPIWLNGYPTDDLIKLDINNGYGRVVEIDGVIVSYAYFAPSEIEYKTELENITNMQSFGRVMVDNCYLKMGIGKFLVYNMINESKKLGKNGMIITADEFNIKAVSLYESFGFKKIGEKQFPYAYLSIYELKFLGG